MRFVIVTGMSGGGKSTAIHMLEDSGFYCVDNLPISLIEKFVELIVLQESEIDKIALGLDVRGGEAFRSVPEIIDKLKEKNIPVEVLFMETNDQVLVKRYKESRRLHPLSAGGRIEDGINREREILSGLRKKADYIIDTTNVSVKLLKERITELFLVNREKGIILSFISFGFKHGIPVDCDTVFDTRCLPNPFYIPELREKTGLDSEVYDYVFSFDESEQFVKKLIDFLDYSVPLYRKEGKAELVVGIGCTGGQHRSVAIAETLRNHFLEMGYNSSVFHRDAKKIIN